ncbi:PA2779 family protein [Arhodomonas sp. SL1]|uniref:PA2779 family protein n=1 Tax=Arhodomonas sp. SL1 TaxID=3425691 RepID=UPI003F883009
MNDALRHSRGIMVLFTAIFLAMTLVAPAGQAAMIGTQTLAASDAADEARERIQAMLEREDVREQLVNHGVDPEMAEERVAALSDAEARQLAARMDELPAGGSSLIGAAVFIFVVLLITDILGFTDVFPFVNKTAR